MAAALQKEQDRTMQWVVGGDQQALFPPQKIYLSKIHFEIEFEFETSKFDLKLKQVNCFNFPIPKVKLIIFFPIGK